MKTEYVHIQGWGLYPKEKQDKHWGSFAVHDGTSISKYRTLEEHDVHALSARQSGTQCINAYGNRCTLFDHGSVIGEYRQNPGDMGTNCTFTMIVGKSIRRHAYPVCGTYDYKPEET
jgi:hypothetical protein